MQQLRELEAAGLSPEDVKIERERRLPNDPDEAAQAPRSRRNRLAREADERRIMAAKLAEERRYAPSHVQGQAIQDRARRDAKRKRAARARRKAAR